MESKRCAACGCAFHPRPQNPAQCHCSAPACQRERRRRWQRAKRRDDPDYRDNQQRAQQAWCRRHPDYWRQYRARTRQHAEARNTRQREHDGHRRDDGAAKTDVSTPFIALPSGTYRMSRMADGKPAKMAVWMVKITVISNG